MDIPDLGGSVLELLELIKAEDLEAIKQVTYSYLYEKIRINVTWQTKLRYSAAANLNVEIAICAEPNLSSFYKEYF